MCHEEDQVCSTSAWENNVLFGTAHDYAIYRWPLTHNVQS